MQKKEEQPDSLIERMKQLPLWQWGGLFIFGAVLSNLTSQMMINAGDMSRAEAKATQMGAAAGSLLLIVVGIVLIVVHFVKRK